MRRESLLKKFLCPPLKIRLSLLIIGKRIHLDINTLHHPDAGGSLRTSPKAKGVGTVNLAQLRIAVRTKHFSGIVAGVGRP